MKIIKFNSFTWYFLIISFLCGYIKTALIILFIVLFHELGHVFFSIIFSYSLKEIIIYPFGGITKIQKDINTPLRQDLIVALGGIIFQLFLFLFPFNGLTKTIFLKYNISIMVFNMLPIIPLDGSLILNAILNKFFSYKKSYLLYVIISFISIIFYLIGNYWFSLNNYLIVTLFVFKTYEAFKNYPFLYKRFLLERYLHVYNFKYISTKEGDLNILKKDTYQFFKESNKIISEKKKLEKVFKKERI